MPLTAALRRAFLDSPEDEIALIPGRRSVRLELGEVSAPVWIAAVLFGQAPDEVPAAASMWVEVSE